VATRVGFTVEITVGPRPLILVAVPPPLIAEVSSFLLFLVDFGIVIVTVLISAFEAI